MYKLNLELTKELYGDTEIKEMIQFKGCYYNAYQVCNFSKLREKFRTGEYKVALSYVSVGVIGLWVRHCVVVNEKNDVIDLTLMTNPSFDSTKDKSNRKYEIVKTFEFEEYNNLIEQAYDKKKENYRCDFPDLEEEYYFYKSRKDKDIFYQINEYDFIEYIMPLLRKYETKCLLS